jgi:hypothetical protein
MLFLTIKMTKTTIRSGTVFYVSLLDVLNLRLVALQYVIVARALHALQDWERVMVYSLVLSNVRTYVSFGTADEMTYRALASSGVLDMVTVSNTNTL